MSIQRVTSKWRKTNALLKSDHFLENIPSTKLFSRINLYEMLQQHIMVYVKPDHGTFGKGVIRVEQDVGADKGYRYQLNTTVRNFTTFELLYQSLLRYTKKKAYLIQKGIYLLTHLNRRFDIRVMVQKNLRKEWEATGIIGRLSHPAKIVTNYHSGGTPMSFERLMSDHLPSHEQITYQQKLNKLSLSIAHELQKTYPGVKEIGVDVAIDTNLHPWILEVNTCPDPFIFRKLKDQSIFRKIYRYASAYGRFKKKKKK